jgi:hypothetical protein
MIQYSLYLFGFLILIFIIIFGICLNTLLKIRLKKVNTEYRKQEDLPSYLKDLFAHYEKELSHLGFEFLQCFLVDVPFVTQNPKKWMFVYVNHAEISYATLSTSNQPEPSNPCNVEFITHFEDGHKLSTVNGIAHTIIGSIPNMTMQDPYTESLEHQWQVHQQTLAKLKQQKIPVLHTSLEFVSIYGKVINEYIESLENRAWIQKDDGGYYHLRIFPALRTTLKIIKGENKLLDLRKKRLKAFSKSQDPAPIPVEIEVEGYYGMSYHSKGQGLGGTGKLFILLFTLALFGLSFGFSLSFKTLIIITVVISLHELGHLLGMHLFKYKDVKIFFLPFLGAATIGSQKDAKPYQKVIVFLLGPLPGIFLGLCLGFYYGLHIEWIRELVLMLLVINYLNLLPIMPLDRGQLFNLFFSRFPLLQIGFQIICGISLLLASGLLKNDPVLFMVGIFLIVGSISQSANMGILSKLRKKIKTESLEHSEKVILPEIFHLLKKKPFIQMSFAKKYQTAKYILENAAISFPSIRLIIVTLLVYLLIFTLPVTLVFAKAFLGIKNQIISHLNPIVMDEPFYREGKKILPNKAIKLSPKELELAGQNGIDKEILLLIKQISKSEIQQLTGLDEEYNLIKLKGVLVSVPYKISEDLAFSLRSELHHLGYSVYIMERHYGLEPDKIGILHTTDPYEILKIKKTDGVNYGITNEDIIAQLKKWEERYPFVIVGADFDWIEIEFLKQPKDIDLLAEEIYKFCPDVVDQGSENIKNLKAEIILSNRLFLWWD